MDNAPHLATLKVKLQSLGALRPEAWERIMQLIQLNDLKMGKSLIRKPGSLAFISDGLLKEYDAQDRDEPTIINFLGSQQCIITRGHNQNHLLKACVPCIVFYWDFESLESLYSEFNELKIIYDRLCCEYDEISSYRLRILEERNAAARIKLFLDKYKAFSPQLMKKDIAKYLQITYNHFIEAYNQLL